MGPGVTTALEKEGSKPCLWHSLAISGMPEPRGEGATGPPVFRRSVNSIQTKVGHILPTLYYWHPQILSPSSIPDSYPMLSCT